MVLFNPDKDSDLTVNVTTTTGTTSVTVPAGSLFKYTMPSNSAAQFDSSDGRDFSAISVVDDEGSTHDWGFTLLPTKSLATILKVGWAPGCDPTSTLCPSPDSSRNYSPVWVTAGAESVTLNIDYNDDGNISPPDATITLTPYTFARIKDPDGDQTGMRIWSADGETLLAAAWGQDPSGAPGARARSRHGDHSTADSGHHCR